MNRAEKRQRLALQEVETQAAMILTDLNLLRTGLEVILAEARDALNPPVADEPVCVLAVTRRRGS